MSLEFFIDVIFPAALWPGVDSACNTNEYQECFVGDKGGRCIGLKTLPPSCADCHEVQESHPPGDLRACPGTALPLLRRYSRVFKRVRKIAESN